MSELKAKVEIFYKKMLELEDKSIPEPFREQLSQIDAIIENLLHLINMERQNLYDIKTNRLITIDSSMIKHHFTISDIDVEQFDDPDCYGISIKSRESNIFSIPILSATESNFVLLFNEESSFFKLSNFLGYRYSSEDIGENGLKLLNDKNLYIHNCNYPVISLVETGNGRLGNNLTALLTTVSYLFEYENKNRKFEVTDKFDNKRQITLDIVRLRHLFIQGYYWNCNVVDRQSRTNDKFGLLKRDGLFALFPYLSKTYYSTYNLKQTAAFNYSGFLYNMNKKMDTFINNVLHSNIKIDYKLSRDDIIIHLHLRHSDYCYQFGKNFPVVHFKYYYDSLNQILSKLDRDQLKRVRLVIFCPKEDRLAAKFLQFYLSDQLSREQIYLDYQFYSSNLSGLEINYVISNFCHYFISSNSTFSILSLALLNRKNIVYFTPKFNEEIYGYNYGVIIDSLDTIRINDHDILCYRINADVFDCYIQDIGFSGLLYLFNLKNSSEYKIEDEYLGNFIEFITPVIGLSMHSFKNLNVLLKRDERFNDIIKNIPECHHHSCFKNFIDNELILKSSLPYVSFFDTMSLDDDYKGDADDADIQFT